MKPTMLTAEEKTALKDEILKAVEEQLDVDAEMTREDAIGAVVNALEALKEEPEMGGMGEEASQGMELPDDSDSDGE